MVIQSNSLIGGRLEFKEAIQRYQQTYMELTGTLFQLKDNFVTHFGKSLMEPIERSVQEGSTTWISVILLFTLLLLVISRQIYPRKFSQSLLAVTGNNHVNQLQREWYPAGHPLGLLYFIAYAILFALYIFVFVNFLSQAEAEESGEFQFYLLILLIVFIVLSFKLLVVQLLSYLFNSKHLTRNYLTGHASFMLLGALILLPLLLILIFNAHPLLFMLTLIILISFMIYRLVRSFFIGWAEGQFALFYLFLYLCALEIVPLLWLIKTVMLIGTGSFII